MDREKSSLYLGLALLIAGIVVLVLVLVSVLGLAANPGPFLQRQIGGGEARAPLAVFAWFANNTSAEFRDVTTAGSSPIQSWSWDFGDGGTGNTRDATHAYGAPGEYFVRLTVRDTNGLEAVAATRVNVVGGGSNNGRSETMPDLGFDFGAVLLPVAVALLTTGMWIVGFLVGGSLVKAGWNLIRPRPETIRIRIKPQNFEHGATAEGVPTALPTPPLTVPAAGPSVPPPPEP
jgi:hypothetical protein